MANTHAAIELAQVVGVQQIAHEPIAFDLTKTTFLRTSHNAARVLAGRASKC